MSLCDKYGIPGKYIGMMTQTWTEIFKPHLNVQNPCILS